MKTIAIELMNDSGRRLSVWTFGTYKSGRNALPYIRRIKERLEAANVGNFHVSTQDASEWTDGHYSKSETLCTVLAGLESTSEAETETETSETSETSEATETTETVAATPVATPVAGDLGSALETLRTVFGGMDRSTMEQLIQSEVARKVEELQLPQRKIFEFPERVEVDAGEIAHPEFETLSRLIAAGCKRLWITGEAGTGKTHAVNQIAEAVGLPVFVVTPVSDKFELYGYNDAHGNYQQTQVYEWATHDGPAVLLLDEVDGCHPTALIAINALLANGIGVFPQGVVKVSDDKVVIATANTTGSGPTLRYVARLAQDGALLDRFAHKLHWGLCPETERKIALSRYGAAAETAITASHRIRKNLADNGLDVHWGPRRTYAMAEAVALAGFTVLEAASLAGLSNLDDQQRRIALEGV